MLMNRPQRIAKEIAMPNQLTPEKEHVVTDTKGSATIRVQWTVVSGDPAVPAISLISSYKGLTRGGWREPDPEEKVRLEEMERMGKIKLGPGGVPDGFWEMPVPEDPENSVRQALIEGRDHTL